jgi:hypothetical protein
MNLKLGKLAPRHNDKTLRLRTYLGIDVPPPPPEKVFREYKIPADAWGMFGNDTIGDCTCAAVAHMIMLFTAHTGTLVTPDPSDIITAYSAITGFDPLTGANDNGAALTDVLEYWQTTGIAGHRILGWVQINHASHLRRQQGIHIFGANDVGVNLPQSAMDQFTNGQTFDVPREGQSDGGIIGGHCIVEAGYGSGGSDFITWGKGDQKGTYRWSDLYLDEAYCVITQDWLNEASGLTPSGFNLDQLTKDLKQLAT